MPDDFYFAASVASVFAVVAVYQGLAAVHM